MIAAVGFGASGKYAAIHADAVATDAAGDTVVTGSFRGTAAFGASASFTSSNTQDAFVADYSPIGTLNWVRTFAGQATTAGNTTTYAVGEAAAVAVDAAGNVFLAGEFTGTVNFGTLAAPTLLSSPAHTEAFVAKLDGSGNLVWVRNTVATGGDDQANALALDGQGGVVVAGLFEQAATFGTTTLTSTGASDAFVARYDPTGAATWAVGTQGTAGSNAQALGVAVDSSRNVAVTGFYSSSVTLGSGSSSVKFTAAGSDDALVWKLDSTGKLLWARSFGSPDYDTAGAVAFDPSGDEVVTGTFSDAVNFSTGTTANVLTAGPIFNAFVLKLDPTGQTTWARAYVGGSGWSKGQAVAVDPFGQVDVAGAFNGAVDFDPGPGADVLTPGGSTDAFAAGLDAAGNFASALQAGQTNFNTALGVAVNAAGAVALTGTYSGSIAFGAVAVPSSGVASAFVARYQTQPTATPAAPALEPASLTGTNSTTSVTSPVFDLATSDPSTVVRLVRDGVAVGQRIGSGPLADPGPVPQGIHLYTAIAVSLAGVASLASVATSVTILTTPPAAPTALGLLAADDSGYLGDGLTNVRTPRITGRAGAGLTVQILGAAGVVLGSGTTATDGTFTIKLASLPDGMYPLRAVAIDAAVNRSAASTSFALAILATPPLAPSKPVLLAADDSGIVGDGITNVRTPRFTLTAGSGLLLFLLNASGAVVGSIGASTAGSNTIAVTSSLADGTYPIYALAIDAAGNASPLSPPTTLVVQTTLPVKLSAPTLLTADDLGVKGDGMTTIRRPRITGVATPGNEVDWVAADGSVLASTTAAIADGSFVIQPPWGLPEGTITVRVRQVDRVGNISPVSLPLSLTIRATTGDFFGDSKTDVAVFRPSINTFLILKPTTSTVYVKPFAQTGDVPVSGDFFGDGVGDVAVYRPSTSAFYEFDPATGATAGVSWGLPGDIPIPGDYDGDGRTDVAVFRPSNASFLIQLSNSGNTYARQWGLPGDIPVVGDFFGNGHADIAVFRPSTATYFITDPITGAGVVENWGVAGDIPVPGDYDGDGKTDLAVFRPSNETFYVLLSSTGKAYGVQWGIAGDVPVAGDYFGNGRASVAVFRPSTETFYALDPLVNTVYVQQWGTTGDRPLQPPLSSNFNLGGGGSAHPSVFVRSGGGAGSAPTTSPVDFVPDSPTLELVPSTVTPTISRPPINLSLERWRRG